MKQSRPNLAPAGAAIGCRVHSGWAAVVVVTGPPKAPVVIDRRRIIIADRAIPGSKQPYHYVETWPLAKAQEHLDRCSRRTRQMAESSISAVVEETRARRLTVIGCGILTASGRPVPTIQEALSSHAMLHTAEGEFYRNAIMEASQECGVPVTRLKEKEIFSHAEKFCGLSPETLAARLKEMGRALGPPWSQDEKLATLMAWMVLAANQRTARKKETAKQTSD